jgi:MoaA/NifB/PqqE/SkfB family radical SAM enzyme
MPKLADKIKEFDSMINWIWLYGGEPLLQDHKDLIKMLAWLTSFKKPIMLFTRFELDQVDDNIKVLVDYIKTGEYNPELKGEVEYYGVTINTTNQKIWKKVGSVWK